LSKLFMRTIFAFRLVLCGIKQICNEANHRQWWSWMKCLDWHRASHLLKGISQVFEGWTMNMSMCQHLNWDFSFSFSMIGI
jgi:hypothetical protein